jgi:hypothetical protein
MIAFLAHLFAFAANGSFSLATRCFCQVFGGSSLLFHFFSRVYVSRLLHWSHSFTRYNVHVVFQLATKRLKRESTLFSRGNKKVHEDCVPVPLCPLKLPFLLLRDYTGSDTLLNACLCFGRRRSSQAQDSAFHAAEWNQDNIFLPTAVAVTLLLSQFIIHGRAEAFTAMPTMEFSRLVLCLPFMEGWDMMNDYENETEISFDLLDSSETT